MIAPRTSAAVVSLALFVAIWTPAVGDQVYLVKGSDSFTIGERDLRSEITYSGRQILTEIRHGKATRFVASVHYTRSDQGARATASGTFEATLTPTGEQRDEVDRDPDYLTVLNQPFSVKLDQGTLAEVARLHGPVPFDFPAPIIGATLHGSLRHTSDGLVDGERALGVAFEATGPMRGPLPDHPAMILNGRIKMVGTAYYQYRGALLLALDATLMITGNVVNDGRSDPVRITYRRSIKADTPLQQVKTAATPVKPR